MPLTTPILLSISGLTGVGGRALMTPLLILGFGLPQVTAVGTDLAYASLTKVAGVWGHWRQPTPGAGVLVLSALWIERRSNAESENR
jgi:uncharacterized membrane protein YfcA